MESKIKGQPGAQIVQQIIPFWKPLIGQSLQQENMNFFFKPCAYFHAGLDYPSLIYACKF
jgi:hypothetical protein